MTTEESQAFYHLHAGKTHKEITKELLKLNPTEMLDCVSEHYEDLIHGWRQALFASDDKVKHLTKKLEHYQTIMKKVEHQLIVLQASHKSNLLFHGATDTLSEHKHSTIESNLEYRHLYIYTNEAPEPGEFYIIFDVSGNGRVYQCVRKENNRVYYGNYLDEIAGLTSSTSDAAKQCHKIIGSTDPALYHSPRLLSIAKHNCARLTDYFVHTVINRYNDKKSIDKVQVQYYMDHVLIDFDNTLVVNYG